MKFLFILFIFVLFASGCAVKQFNCEDFSYDDCPANCHRTPCQTYSPDGKITFPGCFIEDMKCLNPKNE